MDDVVLTNVYGFIVHSLIKAFWEIAVFRAGPESLPDSGPLLRFTLGAYLLLSFPMLAMSYLLGDTPVTPKMIGIATTEVILQIVFQFLFVYVVLKYSGFFGRYRPTMTALFGTDALLSIVITPFYAGIFLLSWYPDSAVLAGFSLLAFIGLMAIILWSLAIYAHIISHALSGPYRTGVVIALLNFLLFLGLSSLIPEV